MGVAVLDTGVAYEDYVDPVTGQVFAKAPDWGDVTFLPGWDAVNNDDHPNDDEWHGTHVASTIAEGTNNVIDLAGLAFGCAIMPVKVLDEFGEGTFFDVAEGIDYAASYSQGGEPPGQGDQHEPRHRRLLSETVKRAVDRAHREAASSSWPRPGTPGRRESTSRPRSPNVIAVGRWTPAGAARLVLEPRPGARPHGPGGRLRPRRRPGRPSATACIQQMPDLDFVALGASTPSSATAGSTGRAWRLPTSSAAAALLISQGITDPEAVRAALEQTARKIGGAPADGRNDEVGYGLIQPAAALSGLGFNQGPVRVPSRQSRPTEAVP